MTAKVTNRLKLMQPTNSDPFTPDDFTQTFGILDGIPGVKPIANFGSLPTGLNTYAHGSMYLQTDQQILWMWNQPTSSSTGSWYKVNSIGMLASGSLATSVTTSATDDTHAATLLSLSITSTGGGGRWFGISAFTGSVSNSGTAGIAVVNLVYNGTVVERAYCNGDPTYGSFGSLFYAAGNPAQGTAMSIKLTLRGFQSGTTKYNAGGGCKLYAFEI